MPVLSSHVSSALLNSPLLHFALSWEMVILAHDDLINYIPTDNIEMIEPEFRYRQRLWKRKYAFKEQNIDNQG